MTDVDSIVQALEARHFLAAATGFQNNSAPQYCHCCAGKWPCSSAQAAVALKAYQDYLKAAIKAGGELEAKLTEAVRLLTDVVLVCFEGEEPQRYSGWEIGDIRRDLSARIDAFLKDARPQEDRLTQEEIKRMKADPEFMASIQRSMEDIKAGRVITLDELREHLNMPRPPEGNDA